MKYSFGQHIYFILIHTKFPLFCLTMFFSLFSVVSLFSFTWTNMPVLVWIPLSHLYQFYCSNYVCSLFQIVLDSDDPLFGGFNRLDHNAEYFSSVRTHLWTILILLLLIMINFLLFLVNYKCFYKLMPVQEGWHDDRPRSFLVYAPSRTAVVYALVENGSKRVEAQN